MYSRGILLVKWSKNVLLPSQIVEICTFLLKDDKDV